LRQAFYDAPLGPNAWHAVIAKANALAADTIRVVRCPEVEVVGEIADPVALHGKDARLVSTRGNTVAEVAAWFLREWEHSEGFRVTRWCLASDLARDPKTATWHERTTQRVRRWTPETVPEPGRLVVRYYADGGYMRDRLSSSVSVQQTADEWNGVGDITHWHDAPDAERAE
jgi:hypothetical protein